MRVIIFKAYNRMVSEVKTMPRFIKKRSAAAGLPPGTSVYIGKKRTEEVRITSSKDKLIKKLIKLCCEIAEADNTDSRLQLPVKGYLYDKVSLFAVLCLLIISLGLWLNEILGLPHIIFGIPPSPFNWREAIIETVLLIIVGIFLIPLILRLIKKRDRAEKELSIAYDALDSSVNGVVITNLEGRIIYANPSFVVMFEYGSKESVIGKYATDLFASDDIRKFSDVEAIINRKNSETEEFTATHKDGTTFAVEVSSSAVTDKKHAISGRMASFVNISKRKQMEGELAEHRDHLEDLVDRRTSQLNAMVESMSGRVHQMSDLKFRLEQLEARLKREGIEFDEKGDTTS